MDTFVFIAGVAILASFTDCQFHGGIFSIESATSYLTNSLFERVTTSIGDDD